MTVWCESYHSLHVILSSSTHSFFVSLFPPVDLNSNHSSQCVTCIEPQSSSEVRSMVIYVIVDHDVCRTLMLRWGEVDSYICYTGGVTCVGPWCSSEARSTASWSRCCWWHAATGVHVCVHPCWPYWWGWNMVWCCLCWIWQGLADITVC